MKASILTLGCKLNKYESDCMTTKLIENDWEVVSSLEVADLYIINTCAVTKESEKKSRQYVTKCLKLNPNAKIVICGCASQNNAEQFTKNANVFSVFGNVGKENILNFINNKNTEIIPFGADYGNLGNPTISTTRAYLKVQDGCNNFCSYCLIPYLRGRSRSRDLTECVAEANKLALTCKEIVLTGIDLSDYKPSLHQLLNNLRDIPARIRIGSLEVRVVDKEFLKTLSSMPNFCPQFHLSLQSGDDKVLKRMNRHYTAREYLSKVKLIRKYFPNANITTDIIVGFAGETEKQFLNTVKLAKKAKFGKIHVFPYSPREGTVAYRYEDCDSATKKARVQYLSNVGAELEQQFFACNINTIHEVLTEDIEGEYVVGYTANYIKTYLPLNTPCNQFIQVQLVQCRNDGMVGKII